MDEVRKIRFNSDRCWNSRFGCGGNITRKKPAMKVLVLDRFPKFGGRMMSYGGYPGEGWRTDIGLKMIELGEKSSCNAVNEPCRQESEWGPFSETVQIWNDEICQRS